MKTGNPTNPAPTNQENHRKTYHILELENTFDSYESLVKDIELQRELYQNKAVGKQFYFDTSSIIDMIRGFNGIIRGGKIKWYRYKKPSTLVYALGYKHWLDNIYTLPPHTEEFITIIQEGRQSKFPDQPDQQGVLLKNEFWGEQELKIHELERLKEKDFKTSEFVRNLKEESLDLFKGIYLASGDSFWKKRYKLLVKDKCILKFSNELDYKLGDITKSKLFFPLLKHLNDKRSDKSSNNYIDAIALCMLDERLNRFYQSKEDYRAIPIFFSDQNHILKAVKEFSESFKIEGRRPFTYHGETGDFLIVRNANYFIIEGIMNAIFEQNSPEVLKEYVKALEALENWLHEKKTNSLDRENGEFKEVVKTDFQRRSEEKFFLEFFDHWWTKGGFEELKEAINPSLLEDKKPEIDQQVHDFVDKERKRINKEFSGYEGRIEIIRKAWSSFRGLSGFIKKNFPDDGIGLDVYKEFSPRFSYTEEVCREVQQLTSGILEAVFSIHREESEESQSKYNEELEEAEAEIVRDLVGGLFDKSETEEEKKNKLDKLAVSLAMLWIFEKYDLIHTVCDVIRQQYENRHRTEDKDDVYPNPSIALMHAASNLLGQNKNRELTERIIKCVKHKFADQYNVWIGLSYIYYLLWNNVADGFEFPELLSAEKVESNKNNEHLKAALEFSQKAVEWLEERRTHDPELEAEDPDPSKVYHYRQRRYFYALNNYIFFLTVLVEPNQFLAIETTYVDKLMESSRDTSYWQGDRFPDTIARYYYRCAYLAENKEDFNVFKADAIQYNDMAIREARKEKVIYLKLRSKLKRLKWKDVLKARKPHTTDGF